MNGSKPENPAPQESGFDFEDPLAQHSPDSADIGWGDERQPGGGGGADDLDRFLQEKPPHHL